jgi:hypothetical protein
MRSCQLVLPEDAIIVANFYDVESGRKDLDARGRSTAHEMFTIPIARDGGIHDLLAEAERPDRRFDYVICESIASRAAPTSAPTSRTVWSGPGCDCWPPTSRSASPRPAGGRRRSPPSC